MTDDIENCCANFEFDSKTLSAWIAHCIEKHVKGDEPPKLKREQCIAAGHAKLRKGELTRGDSLIWISALDSYVKAGETVEVDEEGRPPKAWWDACISTLEKSGQGYTEEQKRKICGAIWFKRGVRKMLPG